MMIDSDLLYEEEDYGPRLFQGRRFTGLAVEFNSEGIVVWSGEFLDGYLNGTELTFDGITGALLSSEEHRYGHVHGLCLYYWTSGQLKFINIFEFSIRLYTREWNEDGSYKGEYTRDKNDYHYKLYLNYKEYFLLNHPDQRIDAPL